MKEKYYSLYKKYLNSLNYPNYLKHYLEAKDESLNEADSIYYYYPLLFHEAFDLQKDQRLEILCLAGVLYYHSLIALDKMIDSQDRELAVGNLTIIFLFQEESIKILTHLFGKDSVFWQYWKKRKLEYQEAFYIGKNVKKMLKNQYEKLADKKSAFGKIALDTLFLISGEKYKEIYENLLLSHTYFSIGNQLVDDCVDIREDKKDGQFNWALFGFEKHNTVQNNPIWEKQFYLEGWANKYYKEAIAYYNKALSIAQLYSCSLWIDTIKKAQQRAYAHIDSINGYIKILETKQLLRKQHSNVLMNLPIVLPKGSTSLEKSYYKGLQALIKEWQTGYVDLQHIMYLSGKEGFSGKSNIHIGDIFQRALLTDIICNIQSLSSINLQEIIDHEVKYLVKNRLKTRIGGWNYFPTVSEIAADIDDLGQIMQVFIKSSNIQYVQQFCEKPISILLNNNCLPNGGIETWIVPQTNRTKLENKQNYFNESKWGKGPDVEVMANFLYALCLYDFQKYKPLILDGCTYLLSQQTKDGYWQSRWYYGNYYGTYVCLRLFKYVNEQKYLPSITKAIDFIKNTLINNTAWGMSNTPDSLNTSLALLSLNLFSSDKSQIEKALKYLKAQQQENGLWESINFIRPKSHEPYKSQTLTSAYVLNVLCRYS